MELHIKLMVTSGHSLIFIHGVGMCADIWEPQVEYFAEKFQVLTYDLLGHGQTQLNNNLPQLNDYVEQLNNLVNSLNISKFFLVGHSMGAIISIAYSLKYPGKILSLIPLNIVFNRTKKARNDVLKRAESILNSKKILNIDQTLVRWFKNKTSSEDLIKIDKVIKYSKKCIT